MTVCLADMCQVMTRVFEDIVPIVNQSIDGMIDDCAEVADALYARMDVNHDGVVVKDEFMGTFVAATQEVCICLNY